MLLNLYKQVTETADDYQVDNVKNGIMLSIGGSAITNYSCTRYGNVSRGSIIPLFIEQIRSGKFITITDPNMTRFLINLDKAVDLVMFGFEHAKPGNLFVQKSDASTIGVLGQAV